MRLRAFGAAAALLLLGACAAGQRERPEARQSGFGWYYKANTGVGADDGPLALYGSPRTLASHLFACGKRRGALEFAEIEVEPFRGKREITLSAGGAAWTGIDELDPPGGVPISRVRIPLGHGLVDAIAAGASAIVIRRGSRRGYGLPNHPIVGRVIRECRAASAAQRTGGGRG